MQAAQYLPKTYCLLCPKTYFQKLNTFKLDLSYLLPNKEDQMHMILSMYDMCICFSLYCIDTGCLGISFLLSYFVEP